MNIKIGDKTIKYPIIQGGMGAGISLGNLSGAVARQGGMGTISTVGIGYREEDFYKNPREANERAFIKELETAREIAQGQGLVGVNIMASINEYEEDARRAAKHGVDFIISGAGLPLNLPELVGRDVLIAPIVSSLKALKLIIRVWSKRYDRYPDFLILEGQDAGGHLGFKASELDKGFSLEDTLEEILAYLEEEELDIPVFVAGSVYDGYDLKKYRELGATGLQIGSRFIATEEADVHENFKNLIVDSTSEDLIIINSPAGLPARAVRNKFVDSLGGERQPSKRCINCLKTCDPATTEFCISDVLVASAKGDMDSGLVFAGSNIDRINKIVKVSDIFEEIMKEYEEI